MGSDTKMQIPDVFVGPYQEMERRKSIADHNRKVQLEKKIEETEKKIRIFNGKRMPSTKLDDFYNCGKCQGDIELKMDEKCRSFVNILAKCKSCGHTWLCEVTPKDFDSE